MKTRTLNDSTQATNQGLVRVTRVQYARYRGLNLLARAWVYLSGFLPSSKGRLRWHRFEEHFRFGDTNPARVLDAQRRLVACYTDLDMAGQSRYHVVKVFVERLELIERGAKNGDEFAAISLYFRASDSSATGRWANFRPIVVDCVSRDETICELKKAMIPDAHWEALELGLAQLGGKHEPGLYAITLPESLKRAL